MADKTNPMQISEQNKQEAEKVLKDHSSVKFDANHFIHAAIKDRQSVLELVEEAIKDIEPDYSLFLHEKLTNLAEQINYLKSKL